jgi:opacity protein-like surface antigen
MPWLTGCEKSMKKILLCIGMFMAPMMNVQAGWSLGAGVNYLELGTSSVTKYTEQYLDTSTLKGEVLSLGYVPEESGWGFQFSFSRTKTSGYSTNQLVEDEDLPNRVSGTETVAWEDINEVVTVGEVVDAFPPLAPYISLADYSEEIIINEEAGEATIHYDIDLLPLYDIMRSRVTLETEIYSLEALHYWNTTENLRLYAGGGLIHVTAKATAEIDIGEYITIHDSAEESLTSIRFTGGAMYNLFDGVYVNAQASVLTDKDYQLQTGLMYVF